jgi:hypothetical protein
MERIDRQYIENLAFIQIKRLTIESKRRGWI